MLWGSPLEQLQLSGVSAITDSIADYKGNELKEIDAADYNCKAVSTFDTAEKGDTKFCKRFVDATYYDSPWPRPRGL